MINAWLRAILVAVLMTVLTACLFTPPTLPPPEADRALLVMGFSTRLSVPYEGGQLYSGFTATHLDGEPIDPPLGKGQYRVLTPGLHKLAGQCYWRLRGRMAFSDDLLEPGTLEWQAEPGRSYTLASEIDEYKFHCALSLYDKPWQ